MLFNMVFSSINQIPLDISGMIRVEEDKDKQSSSYEEEEPKAKKDKKVTPKKGPVC